METSNFTTNGKDQQSQTSCCSSTAHTPDATSVGDQTEQEQEQEQEQTNSGYPIVDQQKAAEATADVSEVNAALKEEDQNDDTEKADIGKDQQSQTSCCSSTAHTPDATSVGDQTEQEQEQTNSGYPIVDQQKAAEATADVSEVNAALKEEVQNDDTEKADIAHTHDATSVGDQTEQEQEQTNSGYPIVDQQKAAEATSDVSEVNAALKDEDQNDDSKKADIAHTHDATSVGDQTAQEQEKTYSGYPIVDQQKAAEATSDVSEVNAALKDEDQNDDSKKADIDQQKAAEATADSSEENAVLKEEDQNDDSEKADNGQQTQDLAHLDKQAQTSSDSQNVTEDECDGHGPTPEVDRSQASSVDDVESTGAQTEGPVLPPGQKDVIKESTFTRTPQAKPCLQDDSRLKDLSRNLPMILAVILIAIICGSICFNGSSTQPDPKEYSSVDIFRREFDKMKTSFPSQRAELWKRSRIHLERHLRTAEPTEPVSMILTSGRGAERTLRCLAGRMAAAFSSALGASIIHIDGAAAAALESDWVKLDIDQRLSGAFEGNGRAAVIHRFEELPPGSTLIFYRYCDHENAAYKKALLVFTVLLEEDELKPHLGLSTVEEMVQDHIQYKFLSSAHPPSFDRMDLDKLSGLWSRISHLILPVAVEGSVEKHGCMIQ